MNKQFAVALEESLREQRKLFSSFDITAIASTAPAKVSQPFHSLLKSSDLLKELKFGSFNKIIIDPASSGDEDEEANAGPTITDVVKQIFDESEFIKVI